MVDFPNYKIDKDSIRTPSPRVLEAGFGDGYSQNMKDGINALDETWSMRFTNRPKADVLAIAAFLDTVSKVTPFNWTPPDEASVKVWRLNSDYPITDAEAGTRSISFTIKRYYGA